MVFRQPHFASIALRNCKQTNKKMEKIEVPISMSVLKQLTLEEMHAILLDLLKILDPKEAVYYLADPNVANKV